MIASTDFHKATYPKPNLTDKRPPLTNILGIDTEAFTDGNPFMYAVSDGTIFWPSDIPGKLLDKYNGTNFMVYNLKYDSGNFLRHLSIHNMTALWKHGKVLQDDIFHQYIPHKMLRLTRGRGKNRITITFWDISQFYAQSLDNASKTYLNKQKMDIRTKRFTKEYVFRFWDAIAKYCIQDAVLTEELGKYLLNKLDEFGLTATSLYSCASLSFKYFCANSKVNTVWRFWNHQKEILALACDAYEGGKFEVTSRGIFTGYEYDITSAYPYEISNLLDLSNCRITYNTRYEPDAAYGFLRCYIDNSACAHIPCGPKIGNVRIYPAGAFYCCVTKSEYEYLLEVGCKVTIIKAGWIFVKKHIYPYRDIVSTLFAIKSTYKGKDKMLYNVSKIVANSFYGKTAQSIEQPDGSVLVGAAWHPIHAAVICANTRLAVTRIQQRMGTDCLAVHTDSVITTKPISEEYLDKDILGKFEMKTQGSGVLIACGMYQIGNKCAFKGFKPRVITPEQGEKHRDTWVELLTRNRNRSVISYPNIRVESWIDAMSKNHLASAINVFNKERKKVDLNCDSKRVWPNASVKGRDLLHETEHSWHKIVVETSPPKHW